jgi:hypothetical protein
LFSISNKMSFRNNWWQTCGGLIHQPFASYLDHSCRWGKIITREVQREKYKDSF